MTFDDFTEWQRKLRYEYPGVEFEETCVRPRGINAVCAGVLVGRFYLDSEPPYGVLFEQARSCGGRN